MVGNVWLALVITFVLAVAWLRFCDFLASKGIISSPTSRKIIHIGTGPVFVLCWLLFPENPESKYIAAVVPLLITLQFFLVGVGVIKDPAAVTAMSRSGDRREILRGPFFYGIVFVLFTIVFWKSSPVGVIALMILCGGDGLADLVGKKFGKSALPWSPKKSWMGSLGMFLGGLVFSFSVLLIFLSVGVFSITLPDLVLKLIVLSIAATVVESLPLKDVDNITVSAAVVLIGVFLF